MCFKKKQSTPAVDASTSTSATSAGGGGGDGINANRPIVQGNQLYGYLQSMRGSGSLNNRASPFAISLFRKN